AGRGPEAERVLRGQGLEPPSDLAFDAFVERGPLVLVRDRSLGIPGWEIHTPPGRAAPLLASLEAQGALRVSAEALDVARVEAGVPIDGREIDADTIPMEARLES